MIGTPFHPRTQPLCVSYDWRSWAGYASASKYELTHDREYYAIRSAAAVIDVSPLFKYQIQGPDAPRLLDRILTRDIEGCPVGRVLYTTWCNEQGYVIDDGTVARLAPDTFRVTAAEPNLRWFQDNAFGLNVTIEDVSEQTAALALQGPNARLILAQLVDEVDSLNQLRFFRVMEATINGRSLSISRTGFTGDLGYELWIDRDDALPVWDALQAAGRPYGLLPAGMLALDIARIEAGLLLIDVDYTPARKARIPAQKSSPFELGLGWTVDLAKNGRFIGQRALRREAADGSRWATVGIEVDWDALEAIYAPVNLTPALPHTAWRRSVPLFDPARGEQVGYASSGCFSPIRKRYIALATLRPDYAQIGTPLQLQVTVEHVPQRAAAQVVKMPFFDPPRKKEIVNG